MVKIMHKNQKLPSFILKENNYFELWLTGVYTVSGRETLQIREFLRFYASWIF